MGLGDIPIDDEERLARIILTDKHVRKDARSENLTAKPEAFLPYKYVELSVIRHRELNEDELWKIGSEVAVKRARPLVGRGDFLARDARAQNLDAVPAEGVEQPRNHAVVVGWPPEKPAQMLRAVQIAAAATYVAAPG
jgi:hypothetical protein